MLYTVLYYNSTGTVYIIQYVLAYGLLFKHGKKECKNNRIGVRIKLLIVKSKPNNLTSVSPL